MIDLDPVQIAENIDWNPKSDWASELEKRYAHWMPLAGLRDPNECYDFHNLAAFYDQYGNCYYVAETSGCSCPAPWDAGTEEVYGPYSGMEAAQKLRSIVNDSYTEYRPEDVTDATRAILNHTSTEGN